MIVFVADVRLAAIRHERSLIIIYVLQRRRGPRQFQSRSRQDVFRAQNVSMGLHPFAVPARRRRHSPHFDVSYARAVQ